MAGRKKILFIFTPYDVGGAEEYVYLLAKGIRHDCDITVILPLNSKIDNFAKRFIKIGITITRLNIKSRRDYKIPTILPTFDIRQIYTIYKEIKRIKPCVIHINQSEPESAYPAIIAASIYRRAKILSTIHIAHSYQFIKVPFASIRDKWSSFFLNLFSFPIIVPSLEIMSLFCKNYSIKKDRTYLLHYGIDIQGFSVQKDLNLQKKITTGQNCCIVGFIGRLHKQKCPVDFLKVALKVNKKRNGVYFIVLGEGELEQEMRQFIQDNKLDHNVKLLGHISDVPQYMSIIDILVLPSFYETLPFVLIEAGAAGKPAIASNVGGIKEIIKDGVTGFLIDPYDTDKYAEKIIYLIENPDIANKMGVAAQKRVHEKFSLDRMARDTMSVYEKLLIR